MKSRNGFHGLDGCDTVLILKSGFSMVFIGLANLVITKDQALEIVRGWRRLRQIRQGGK